MRILNQLICFVAAILLTIFSAASFAADLPEEGTPPVKTADPLIELKQFVVSPDIEVSLFAHEPMVENPTAMHFDAKGRLWVSCAPSYPHVRPGIKPNDYLVTLEDTNRDGKADKHTVFCDGLYVPTGFEFGDGGVYVASQPHLLHLKDTDSDGKADVRRIVLTGFGSEDNHHAINAWRWGPGGNLHFQQGVFLRTNVETPYGVTRINETGGMFSFDPRRSKLDVYVQDGTNPWGLAFDRWGQDFMTEAPQGGIYFLLPNTVSNKPTHRAPTMASAPKSCGIEFVSGSHFPDDWQGDMILNAFKDKQVLRYKFSEDGSGFAAKEVRPPLIVSREENFRPVDVKMGPDGAIYILDWYNPIIGHMQYNFRDPRRDHHHGRVWRITAKNRPLMTPPKIDGQRIEYLLEQLKSPYHYTRHLAKRELYDRDAKQVAAALGRWVKTLDAKDADVEHHKLEALWTYQTIDVVNAELLKEVLTSKEPKARAAAVRVLRSWLDRVENPVELLEKAVRDDYPRVRLEAVVTLSYVPSKRAYDAALAVVDKKMDRYLEYAWKHTIDVLKKHAN